jgi:prephenate dehydrogenase
MKVLVVGLGLIGGSMAIDIRRRHFADEIYGVEADPINAAAALKIGLVDQLVTLQEGIGLADFIIIAVPVGAAVKLLVKVLDEFDRLAQLNGGKLDKTVIDVCSTKEMIIRAVDYHKMRKYYVATHPMSGTEYCGPWAALPDLFNSKAAIICNSEDSEHKSVALVDQFYKMLNMRTIYMNASNHDVHAAYVSHLSHVISFALSLTVLDKEKDDKHIFDMASGGFSSTVRLAKSNSDMWVPIFTQNKENVLQVLETYMDKLNEFKTAMEAYDEEKLRDLIDSANRIKRIIK